MIKLKLFDLKYHNLVQKQIFDFFLWYAIYIENQRKYRIEDSYLCVKGAAAYQLGNTSSRTITEVKQS